MKKINLCLLSLLVLGPLSASPPLLQEDSSFSVEMENLRINNLVREIKRLSKKVQPIAAAGVGDKEISAGSLSFESPEPIEGIRYAAKVKSKKKTKTEMAQTEPLVETKVDPKIEEEIAIAEPIIEKHASAEVEIDPKIEENIAAAEPIVEEPTFVSHTLAPSPVKVEYIHPAQVHVIDTREKEFTPTAETACTSEPFAAVQSQAPFPLCDTAKESTDCCEESKCCCHPISWLGLGYTFGKGIETDKNYATAEVLLFPNWGSYPVSPFISAAGHYLSDHKWAGSFGLGARWALDDCWVAGANVFYDSLRRDLGTYQDVGVGLELLSYTWEARVNGYFPVGTKWNLKHANSFKYREGNYFIKIKTLEQVSRGFDAEIGYNYYFCPSLRFYTGVGPAWFKNSYWKDDHWAFKGRALLEWNRYLTLEARTFKEESRKWHWQGVATLWIPFECLSDCCCGLLDLFSRPIYRNAMLKSSKDCCWETNF